MLGAPPIKVDLTARLNLEQPDRWVKVSNIAWLPLMVTEEIIKIERLTEDKEDIKPSDNLSEITAAIANVLKWIVTDWNLTFEDLGLNLVDGFDGEVDAVAPIPSVDITTGGAVNMIVAMELIGAAGEDDGEVPKVSESSSQDELAPESSPPISPVAVERN